MAQAHSSKKPANAVHIFGQRLGRRAAPVSTTVFRSRWAAVDEGSWGKRPTRGTPWRGASRSIAEVFSAPKSDLLIATLGKGKPV